MQSRVHLGLSLVSLLAALLVSGCKTAEKQDDIDAGAAPVASADPLPSATVPAPTVVAPTPIPAGTTPTTKLDAGAPADAGAPTDAGAGTDAGKVAADAGTATSVKLKACADKCQAVLAGCVIPEIPKDGGLPQIKDPVACQAAANACFSACAP